MIDSKIGDVSVDPMCVGWWESERPRCGWVLRKEWGTLFQRWGDACWKEQCVVLRDEEVGDLDMVITSNVITSTVRRLNRDQFKKIRRLRGSKNFISEREACTQYVSWPLASGETWEQEWSVRTWEIWQQCERESFGFVEVDLSENLVDWSTVSSGESENSLSSFRL